jgi:hypothetical protein
LTLSIAARADFTISGSAITAAAMTAAHQVNVIDHPMRS